jgi:hypothetical protein
VIGDQDQGSKTAIGSRSSAQSYTHAHTRTRPSFLITFIDCMDRTTWWLWRGARTRSLPELGRENPQRPWYCVSRHGRVGRRQVFQSMQQPTGVSASQQKPPVADARIRITVAGWSSPVARQAHNLKVTGSNPVPATNLSSSTSMFLLRRRERVSV